MIQFLSSVRVCVWNIWTDVKLLLSVLWFILLLFRRGTGADLPIQSNEAMAFRWMSGLINHLYLHFYQLWHAAKPRTAPSIFFDFVYVCRNLNSLWFYSTGLSFSPFQNSALRAISELVYFLPFAFSYMEFPMDTSYGIQIMFLCFSFLYFISSSWSVKQIRNERQSSCQCCMSIGLFGLNRLICFRPFRSNQPNRIK